MQERRKEIMRGLKGLPGRNPPRLRCVPGENSTDDLQQCLTSALKGPGVGYEQRGPYETSMAGFSLTSSGHWIRLSKR